MLLPTITPQVETAHKQMKRCHQISTVRVKRHSLVTIRVARAALYGSPDLDARDLDYPDLDDRDGALKASRRERRTIRRLVWLGFIFAGVGIGSYLFGLYSYPRGLWPANVLRGLGDSVANRRPAR